MSGTLYVIGTPIGNLSDLSPRAVEVLESVDFIAAEDTRVSVKLLNHFGIKKPLTSYFEHNKRDKGEAILQRILAGENCAIVTDAGMPAISDPGEDLVALCHENGIEVHSVPGPTAFATALAISGMPSARFSFEGFLSVNKKTRREHLDSIAQDTRTLIFYEAPHKLAQTLVDLFETLGDRQLAIVREITKIHEEVIRTTLKEASEKYNTTPLKGEIVLIVHGAEKTKEEFTLDQAVKIATEHAQEGFSLSDSAKYAAKETGIKKGDIYRELVN